MPSGCAPTPKHSQGQARDHDNDTTRLTNMTDTYRTTICFRILPCSFTHNCLLISVRPTALPWMAWYSLSSLLFAFHFLWIRPLCISDHHICISPTTHTPYHTPEHQGLSCDTRSAMYPLPRHSTQHQFLWHGVLFISDRLDTGCISGVLIFDHDAPLRGHRDRREEEEVEARRREIWIRRISQVHLWDGTRMRRQNAVE